jgi:hypothetical protein
MKTLSMASRVMLTGLTRGLWWGAARELPRECDREPPLGDEPVHVAVLRRQTYHANSQANSPGNMDSVQDAGRVRGSEFIQGFVQGRSYGVTD